MTLKKITPRYYQGRPEGKTRSRAQILLLLASLAGAVFSLLNATGADLLCLSAGCRIYASYGIFGISFYTLGAVGFAILFLLGMLQKRRPFPTLLAAALILGLSLDILFLAWQALFWPCFGCLTVAFLLGSAAAAAFSLTPPATRKFLLGAGAVWLVFFAVVALAAGKELVFKPWPIAGDPAAPTKVFFSPDCPTCSRVVGELVAGVDAADIAFFPVVKGEADRRRLASFLAGRSGTIRPQDLLALFEEGEASPPLDLRTRLGLLANKAALARTGSVTVPLILAPSLPERSGPRLDLHPSSDNLFSPPADAGCLAFEDKECD